jgi:MT0933-like antitoxin protein
MGVMDKLKGMFSGNKDTVNKGIDTAADKAQDATGHKYDQPIDTGADKAKEAVEKLDD